MHHMATPTGNPGSAPIHVLMNRYIRKYTILYVGQNMLMKFNEDAEKKEMTISLPQL